MNLSLSADQVTGIEAMHDPAMFHAKFFRDPQQWVTRAFMRALDMKVQHQNHRMWCLDIGSAIPYFAWVVRNYDHEVLSIDIPDPKLIKAAELLECEFQPHVVSLDSPLPVLPHRFDLVTMFGVNLTHADGDLFTADEYGTVIQEVFRLLVPGGRLIVGMNHGLLDDVWQHLAWWEKLLPADLASLSKNENHWITVKAK